MIKKITKLINVGCFSNFSQEKNFQYGDNNCNIIFGFNGSGKTTISNTISFFADNTFIDEDEKRYIFNDIKNSDNSFVELELNDGNKSKYPNQNHPHSKSIYIFNSHFVATHVFNGTKGKMKKFSNTSGEIKNKEIDRINYEIAILDKEKIKLENKNKSLDEKHKEITKIRSRHFGNSLTDRNKSIQVQNLHSVSLPSKTIDELEKELNRLIADYELSKKQDDLKTDLEYLKQINFTQNLTLDLKEIDNLLSKNIQQLSKDTL